MKMTVIDKLIDLRKRKNLSQMELAEAVGVSRQTVSKWETGMVMPSAENLKSLSRLYGVPIGYLMDETVSPEDWSALPPVKAVEPEPVPVDREVKKFKWYITLGVVVLVTIILTVLVYRGLTNEGLETLTFDQMESESWNNPGAGRVELDTEW